MLIRKLHGHERPLFADHLKRLSADDRQFRFARANVSDEVIDAYVASIASDHLVVGCFIDDRLVAGVHVAFDHGLAEVGVSVDMDHRVKGIGAELFRRAIHWARNRRAEKLYTLCQSDNRAMVALARKLDMQVHRESGTAEAFLALTPPDLLSVSDELSMGMSTVYSEWADMVRTCQDALLPPQRGER
ncbi:GNAT family N-acetyltransferase [Magnetospirillum aberrantis]|uniref:GNAT family N-acetyltransferase n=1 Tax=Magnetospirillum aberrantis SpK TaxID=908842 RepID=A0A7C9UZB2_9PROT|nr:GNAT family N-acetyltransferase [Magnetospirillum aberrantis]NFV80431.1 GNAT family N-acetyltransferase [Magnetospirillum aberrantis SpK]